MKNEKEAVEEKYKNLEKIQLQTVYTYEDKVSKLATDNERLKKENIEVNEESDKFLKKMNELIKEMNELKGVNWSQETRQFLEQRIERLKVLHKLDELTKHSRLTEEDAVEMGREINRAIAKRHGLKI